MKSNKLTIGTAIMGIILLCSLGLCAFVARSTRVLKLSKQTDLQLPDSLSWYNDKDTLLDLHTADDLYAFAQLINSGASFAGKTVRLQDNILLNDTTGWRQWDTLLQELKSWEPIGTRQTPFQGIFDGQGHTISGLYIHSGTAGLYQGLFGVIARATIRNLGLRASYIHAYDHVGGIVGFMQNHSKLDACFNEATVHADRNMAGGLVGRAEGVNTLVNCYNLGLVSGGRHVGGLVGDFRNGSIYNCYNQGSVRGKYENTGGIVGCLAAEYNANERQMDTLANCYNTGTVYGRDVVGGLVGYLALNSAGKRRKGAYFANCYNGGKLRSRFPLVTDGLVGLYNGNMDTTDFFQDTVDNDEKLIIEFNGDACYWSLESCTVTKLDRPRFSRYIHSDQWMRMMLNQGRTPELFLGLSAEEMQSATFVATLNKWVDKRGDQFNRWTIDGLDQNSRYPVFKEAMP